MTDDPPAALLEAVVADAERAGLEPGFAQKVAANALGIAGRERALGPAATARARARLATLLGREGSQAELTRALCEAMRDDAALCEAALVEHLILTSLDKLGIDQPGYPAFAALRDQAVD